MKWRIEKKNNWYKRIVYGCLIRRKRKKRVGITITATKLETSNVHAIVQHCTTHKLHLVALNLSCPLTLAFIFHTLRKFTIKVTFYYFLLFLFILSTQIFIIYILLPIWLVYFINPTFDKLYISLLYLSSHLINFSYIYIYLHIELSTEPFLDEKNRENAPTSYVIPHHSLCTNKIVKHILFLKFYSYMVERWKSIWDRYIPWYIRS